MTRLLRYILLPVLFIVCSFTYAQGYFEPIPFGNMNTWITRTVSESFLIGDATKTLYEIDDSRDEVAVNTPFVNRDSPWATSSVYADVHGIVKGSVTVFPEKRGDGYCARLESKLEKVKVLGVIDIYALATGTIFLGQMVEPITGTDNPQHNLISGIPFTKKPNYLQFDYKAITGGSSYKINGMSSEGTLVNDQDNAEVQVMLQKRWEDAAGDVYALRIGTGWEIISKTVTTWQNKHRIEIHYGNISNQPYYKNYMGLRDGAKAYYTRNSKGKIVPIHEIGWGKPTDKVTDLIVQFSVTNGGPFVGNPKNKLWIDNVGFVYDKKP